MFYGLTDEDRLIFRRLTSVRAQAAYHRADRRDYQLIIGNLWER